ncbi:transcriptional regulator [Heliobacterium chlorum]|uniref:Transcriptional regulator n=1 Tax=Heliobacterium chlorum TaxID=2698 RepID=A0ABR7T8I4_HELCL|nr:helix-turn-helix transcriptional regulator [Heliobacterium chlorum]MBC9785916.1 transcriptional regulator [Heliobacterium chlorum]
MVARKADPLSPEERLEIAKKQIETGIFLAELRKEKGLTYNQLAEQLGVSGSYLSKLEKGTEYPSDHLVRKLADFYGILETDIFEKLGRIPLVAREVIERFPHYSKAIEQIEKDPDLDETDKNEIYDQIAEMHRIVYEKKKLAKAKRSAGETIKGVGVSLGLGGIYSSLAALRDRIDDTFIALVGWHNYMILEDCFSIFLAGIVAAPLITYLNYRWLKGLHKWIVGIHKNYQMVIVIDEDGTEHQFSDPQTFLDYLDLIYFALFPKKFEALLQREGERKYFVKKDIRRSRAILTWMIVLIVVISAILLALIVGVTPEPPDVW